MKESHYGLIWRYEKAYIVWILIVAVALHFFRKRVLDIFHIYFYVELWAPPKTPIIEGRSQFIQFAIINIHYLRMLVWSHKLENCSSWEECFKHCLNIFECWILNPSLGLSIGERFTCLTCKNLKTRQSEDPCIAL